MISALNVFTYSILDELRVSFLLKKDGIVFLTYD